MQLSELWLKFKLDLQFDIPEQLEFLEFFESFVSGGQVSTIQALESVKETYLDVYGASHIVHEVCQRMINAMKEGMPTKDIMNKYFHPTIAIGYELAQKTTEDVSTTKELINLVSLERELKKETLGKLFVPSIVLLMGVVAQVMIGSYLIPAIERMRKIQSEAFEVVLSKYISVLLVDYGLVTLLFIGGIIIGLKHFQDNYTGVFRTAFDKIWPFSLYRILWGVRVLKLTGLLKSSGQRDVDAYRLIKKHGNPYINEKIDLMIEGVKAGRPRKEYFAVGLLEKAQKIRLQIASMQSDSAFTRSLLDVAERAVIDIKMTNSKVLKRWIILLFTIGISLLAFAIGGVVESISAK